MNGVSGPKHKWAQTTTDTHTHTPYGHLNVSPPIKMHVQRLKKSNPKRPDQLTLAKVPEKAVTAELAFL